MRGGIEQPVCWIPHNKRVVLTKIGFQATEREYSQNTIYPIRVKRQEKTIKSTREKEDRRLSLSEYSKSETERNRP